uniref:Carboxylesterase type B domain-containing protein n=1 Tax=Panagrolaimus sp. ES5 TaxID=591445 RepID=A0AC34GKB1_9BILA
MSDLNFNVPALREANLKAKNKNPTFFYVFDYNGDIADTAPKQARGASHGADIINLFGGLYKEIQLNENGRKVQQKFVELIGSFIKNG